MKNQNKEKVKEHKMELTPKQYEARKVTNVCIQHEVDSNDARGRQAVPEDEVPSTLLEVVVSACEIEHGDGRDKTEGSHDDSGRQVGMPMAESTYWTIRTAHCSLLHSSRKVGSRSDGGVLARKEGVWIEEILGDGA